MTQTPERRMWLMYKALKKRGGDGGEWYSKGRICSPLMSVARAFKVPVRDLKEIFEAQRIANGLTAGESGIDRGDEWKPDKKDLEDWS